MKRAAVFAHYDKDKIIDDYVVYYLNALKDIAQKIVFVSCCELPDKEKSKLDGIADYIIAEKHDEYDFGSYKRGFVHLKESLNDYDEMIFANDSCYGPLFPLQDVFDKMEADGECDFWGITRNKFGTQKRGNKYVIVKSPHLQSYFIVLNKSVFQSNIFDDFMKSIKHHDNKNDIIINYEIGLSTLLVNSGFRQNSYVKDFYRFNHVLISLWRLLVKKCKSPFIKCSILRQKNQDLTYTDGWKEFLGEVSDYPISIIEKNLDRTMAEPVSNKQVPVIVKKIYFNILVFQPAIIKKIMVLSAKFLSKLRLLVF